jgi:hypothetical protein
MSAVKVWSASSFSCSTRVYLGGLPKLSWEPRKPVPLGTMFLNGAECTSGILMSQDIMQDAEVMKAKEYFGEKSSMLNGM